MPIATHGADGRVRVLVMAEYYLPGYHGGGPIRTLSSLVACLGDRFDFSVITSDRDLGASEPYPDVEAGRWTPVGLARVLYCAPADSSIGALRRRLAQTPFDVLYLNSCWSPRFTLAPLLLRRFGLIPSRPVVLASRGEFAPGALAVKRTKKRLFLALARIAGLYHGLIWQASSEVEAAQIRSTIPSARDVRVAPNPTPAPSASAWDRTPKAPGTLRIVWLGRIATNKNLLGALRSLRHVSRPVRYDIYGPFEDAAYWEECERAIAALPAHVKVEAHGSVHPEAVAALMQSHDLLLLPTHGENFGQAIFEALSNGCPVLISDRTPWQGLEERRAGWALPVEDEAGFARVIDACAGMSEEEHAAWSAGAVAAAEAVSRSDAGLQANAALFEAAAKGAV